MRILVLNYEYPPIGGGGAPASREIARGYVQKGHVVHVVSARFGELPFEELVDGMRVYRLPCLPSRKELSHPREHLSFVVAAMRFLRRHLKYHAYDVCHAHFLLPTGLVALYLRRQFGLPYLITAHGSDIPGYNVDRFKLLHRFTPPLLRRICDSAVQIVAPSDYVIGLLGDNIQRYPEGKVIKIPNGIDLDQFVPLRKENIILATGRFLPRKGFQHLIRAVSDVDLGFEVHICGDGPMRAQLQQLAARSRTRIIFHGWVDASSFSYRQLLASASIFVLPSTCENASISLLEGMSAGCAMVTSNVSGCPETVAACGVLIDPTDTAALTTTLIALTRDSGLRERLQTSARQRVAQVFAWDRIAQAYEHRLLSAIGGTPQQTGAASTAAGDPESMRPLAHLTGLPSDGGPSAAPDGAPPGATPATDA